MASGRTSDITRRTAAASATSVSMSMTATSSPLSFRWAASHCPTNPLPPVMSARIRRTLLRGRQRDVIGADVGDHPVLPGPLSGHGQAEVRALGPAAGGEPLIEG